MQQRKRTAFTIKTATHRLLACVAITFILATDGSADLSGMAVEIKERNRKLMAKGHCFCTAVDLELFGRTAKYWRELGKLGTDEKDGKPTSTG